MSDFNHSIIEEFHANGGKVGGPFEGIPLLLLPIYAEYQAKITRTIPVVVLTRME